MSIRFIALMFAAVLLVAIICVAVLHKLDNEAVSECIRAGRAPLECRASIRGLR